VEAASECHSSTTPSHPSSKRGQAANNLNAVPLNAPLLQDEQGNKGGMHIVSLAVVPPDADDDTGASVVVVSALRPSSSDAEGMEGVVYVFGEACGRGSSIKDRMLHGREIALPAATCPLGMCAILSCDLASPPSAASGARVAGGEVQRMLIGCSSGGTWQGALCSLVRAISPSTLATATPPTGHSAPAAAAAVPAGTASSKGKKAKGGSAQASGAAAPPSASPPPSTRRGTLVLESHVQAVRYVDVCGLTSRCLLNCVLSVYRPPLPVSSLSRSLCLSVIV
jgi:hypothetical protein